MTTCNNEEATHEVIGLLMTAMDTNHGPQAISSSSLELLAEEIRQEMEVETMENRKKELE